MNNFYIKFLLVVLGMGFCIFFGVDLATRGVERISGPVVNTAPVSGGVRLWPQAEKPQEAKAGAAGPGGVIAGQNGSKAAGAAGASQAAEAKAAKETKVPKEEVEPKAEINETAGIARVGNKAGELLQIVAHHGIRWFVSLFEMVMG